MQIFFRFNAIYIPCPTEKPRMTFNSREKKKDPIKYFHFVFYSLLPKNIEIKCDINRPRSPILAFTFCLTLATNNIFYTEVLLHWCHTDSIQRTAMNMAFTLEQLIHMQIASFSRIIIRRWPKHLYSSLYRCRTQVTRWALKIEQAWNVLNGIDANSNGK